MDPFAGDRLNEASKGKEVRSEPTPDHERLDCLLEPRGAFQGSSASNTSNPTSSTDFRAETSFWSGFCEQVASLGKTLRRTARSADVEAYETCSLQGSAPDVQQQPLRYLTLLAAAFTGIWGWRAGRSIERVIARRYSDIAYQIRRPDSLSARITAFKVLVLGGLVVPGSAVAVASWQSRLQTSQPTSVVPDSQERHLTRALTNVPESPSQTSLAVAMPLPVQAELRRMVGFADVAEGRVPNCIAGL